MTPLHHAIAIDNGEGEFCIPMKVHAIERDLPGKRNGHGCKKRKSCKHGKQEEKVFFRANHEVINILKSILVKENISVQPS